MKKSLIFIFLLCSIVSFTQKKTGTITDTRDGKVYKIVVIGTQTWMTENLNVSKFRNGDSIPQIKSDEEWEQAGQNKEPAWCYYDNDQANGTKYGKLYNWYAVNDPRGLAPAGFHIATDTEWIILSDFLGGDSIAGKKMKTTSGWRENGNGINTSGFSGLPGGFRSLYGIVINIGELGYWWSSTELSTPFAYGRYLKYENDQLIKNNYGKERGLSVRCLKD
jgi:uncharacterized protein (TIGR02145 family)